MRKKIILLIIISLLPIRVFALTGNISMSCDKEKASAGEVISCTITGTGTNGSVSSVYSAISLNSNLIFQDFITDSSWQGNAENGTIDLYTDSNKSNTFPIGVLKVKVKDGVSNLNAAIELKDSKFTDENFKTVNLNSISKTIRIPSNVNTLDALTVENATLTPSFSSSITNYSAIVNAEETTISSTKTDSNSTVSGSDGKVKLNYGLNTFNINVKSESGIIRTYTLSITRPDNRSKDNTLKLLKIDDVEVALKEGIFEYSYNVLATTSKIIIEAELNDDKASFVNGFEPRTVELKEGDNKILIKVLAENEEEQVYILNVKKESLNKTSSSDDVSSSEQKNNELVNPDTGIKVIFITIFILIVSIISIVYYYKKYRKSDSNNEK